LFIETYIDILLSAGLNFFALYQTNEQEDFLGFFDSFDNIMCSSIAVIAFFLVLMAPIHIAYIVQDNYENIHDPKVIEKYGVYFEEYHCATKATSMYTVIMMVRRLLMISVLMALTKYPFI
jgi:hypothetical protein